MYNIGLLGEDGTLAEKAGSDGGAVRWDGDLERNKVARAKVSFRPGENVGKVAEDAQGRGD